MIAVASRPGVHRPRPHLAAVLATRTVRMTTVAPAERHRLTQIELIGTVE
jgi:hypothetical protein